MRLGVGAATGVDPTGQRPTVTLCRSGNEDIGIATVLEGARPADQLFEHAGRALRPVGEVAQSAGASSSGPEGVTADVDGGPGRGHLQLDQDQAELLAGGGPVGRWASRGRIIPRLRQAHPAPVPRTPSDRRARSFGESRRRESGILRIGQPEIGTYAARGQADLALPASGLQGG